MGAINQFDIFLVKLNPTKGSEINKTRPCVIVSPDEMKLLHTVIIAPMTTKGFNMPFRIKIQFQNKQGLVLLDQIRAVDKTRLVKRIGVIDESSARAISQTLIEMFKI